MIKENFETEEIFMQRGLNFIPQILLCGEESEFLSRVGQRPFKIVGHVKIFGEVDEQPLNFLQDGKIFLNGKLQHFGELLKMLRGAAVDYLVFNAPGEFSIFKDVLKSIGFRSSQVVTLEQFKVLPPEFFYDIDAELQLLNYLKNISLKTLLDADACFAKGRLFTKADNDFTEIDCISDKPLLPIKENIYRRVYKNFSEIGFRRYDAALIAERPPVDFYSIFTLLENITDKVITFARTGSELEKSVLANKQYFSDGGTLRTNAGSWFLLTRHKPRENFCVYVVTHKPTPHDGKLPEGYKIIHAGRALNPDLGYAGDNTGDNISDLNLFINEVTALYWFWKNANNSVVGLCHYRRFFTESNDDSFAYEKILTQDAALKLLQDYDILVAFHHGDKNQHEIIENDCGIELTNFGEAIIKKYLLQVQPDYIDAFDYVLSSTTFYKCNMFVTRRDIFDAYCKWLFSFIIDATREVLNTTNLASLPWTPRRLMSFLAERMFSVWIMNNRLRIKELKVMKVPRL